MWFVETHFKLFVEKRDTNFKMALFAGMIANFL